MKIYVSIAKDRSFVEILALAKGPGKRLGDLVRQVGGRDGDKTFLGHTLEDFIALGAGEQDIEPKGRDRDETDDEEG